MDRLDSLEPLKSAGLLVIDDLGKATASEWRVARTWEVVDYRYSEERPTVITSQYSLDRLYDRIARRGDYDTALAMVSRLYEVCDIVPLSGEDRRLGREER